MGAWSGTVGAINNSTTHRGEPLQVRLKCLRRALTQLRGVSNFLMTEQWQAGMLSAMRGLHIIFQYSTTQPSTPSQPTIIIQCWICQKIYTETSPLMLLTTWLQRPTRMTTVFLASWQQNQPWQFFCIGLRRHHLSSRVSFTLPTCYSLIILRLIDQNYKVTQTYFWQS